MSGKNFKYWDQKKQTFFLIFGEDIVVNLGVQSSRIFIVIDFYRFDSVEPGSKIGFGIEGEWLSEYVPGPDCKYYFVEGGVKVGNLHLIKIECMFSCRDSEQNK